MATADNTRRRQTDRATADAQSRVNRYVTELMAISNNPNPERVTEITVTAVRDILFTALQHAPITDTGHAQADATLRRASAIAALQAREAVHPAVECNLTARRPRRNSLEKPEEWLHRMAPTLTAAGQGVRDVYRALLMAATDSLGRHGDTKKARQQAVDLCAHVSTVLGTSTNLDAVRKRMPSAPDPLPTPKRR